MQLNWILISLHLIYIRGKNFEIVSPRLSASSVRAIACSKRRVFFPLPR
jgi:hypothetical protein